MISTPRATGDVGVGDGATDDRRVGAVAAVVAACRTREERNRREDARQRALRIDPESIGVAERLRPLVNRHEQAGGPGAVVNEILIHRLHHVCHIERHRVPRLPT